jgi:hypothetical protein
MCYNQQWAWWDEVGEPFLPALKGTTEEKGEYGRASSTVSVRWLVFLDLFSFEAPFEPFTMPPGI